MPLVKHARANKGANKGGRSGQVQLHFFFLWPAAGAKRGFQAKLRGGGVSPMLAAEGLAALRAQPDRF